MQNLIHIIFIFGEPQGLVLKLKLFVLAINDFFFTYPIRSHALCSQMIAYYFILGEKIKLKCWVRLKTRISTKF